MKPIYIICTLIIVTFLIGCLVRNFKEKQFSVLQHNKKLNILKSQAKELSGRSDSLTAVILKTRLQYHAVKSQADSIEKMKDWQIAQLMSKKTGETVVLRDSVIIAPLNSIKVALIQMDSLEVEREKNRINLLTIAKQKELVDMQQKELEKKDDIIRRLENMIKARNIAGGSIILGLIILLFL